MRTSRKLVFAVLSGWLALSLACNFPVDGQGSQSLPPGISQDELRQTLAAQPYSTLATQPLASTPVPVLSTVTPGAPLSPVQIGTTGFVYSTQPGDTLPALAARFGVVPEQIVSTQPLPAEAYLNPGITLNIPAVVGEIAASEALLPDSEIVYSPATVGFDLQGYIEQAGGYLSTYSEIVNGQTLSGAEIIRRVALESSTNPRLLLALLEYRSHWVLGQPATSDDLNHPLGFYAPDYRGLYHELVFTAPS
jgi:LysM repeat protein